MNGLFLRIAVLLFLGACRSPSPMEAFDRFALALEQGDLETAYAGLTPDSARIVRGLVDTEQVSSPDGAVTGLFPTSGLSATTRAVSVIGGDGVEEAVLRVVTDTKPAEEAIILMRSVGGEWRIDLVRTELTWNNKWELSGSRSAGPPGWVDEPLAPLE